MTSAIKILVVEDEVLIAMVVKEGLEEAGYEVVDSTSAEAAIALLEADRASYRAIVTDVNFASKNLTGWDVGRRARELTGDLPIIYVSGASGHEWTAHGVPNSVMIGKPFAIGQIVTAVSQLLNAGAPGLSDQVLS